MKNKKLYIGIIILLLLSLIVGFSYFSFQKKIVVDTYDIGVIGNDRLDLEYERSIGIDLRLFSLSWRRINPQEGLVDQNYITDKLEELNELYASGYSVILSLGLHDTPNWIHENYEDSYLVNQFGQEYIGSDIDEGTANLIFNRELQSVAEDYIALVFDLFDTNFYAVRVGGGRYGELTYPPAEYGDSENNYWAFDANALAQSPASDWIPGDISDNNEASLFLDWYLDVLLEFQNWQIRTIRNTYMGDIMVLYPSWGIRPGDVQDALATNLDGSSSAERNGEIQRGFDFSRQIASIDDPNIIVTTTWLDANSSQDSGTDLRYWSPVKYLDYLVTTHPLALRMFGENSGRATLEEMQLSFEQMTLFGLQGLLWYNEAQLLSEEYANWEDLQQLIAEIKQK